MSNGGSAPKPPPSTGSRVAGDLIPYKPSPVGYWKIERVKGEGYALLPFPCPRLRLRAAPVRTKALDPK
jgi:hypothetical protein